MFEKVCVCVFEKVCVCVCVCVKWVCGVIICMKLRLTLMCSQDYILKFQLLKTNKQILVKPFDTV